MKNRITGRSAFLALLKDEGHSPICFGNPGTTELADHARAEGPSDLTYVMAMQESLVVAIADGYTALPGGSSPATSMSRRPSAMRWARSTTRNSQAPR